MPVGKGLNMRNLKIVGGLCLQFAWMAITAIAYTLGVILISLWCMVRTEKNEDW